MQDREIAYEQNVTGLEIAWADRIKSFAAEALRDNANEPTSDALLDNAVEAVAARLLDSLQWENVEAKDISDIAFEAVHREYDSQH
jgi:hypothetical protein